MPEMHVVRSPYTARDVVRLASRLNNAKRGYLLVDPLQGKHMPADPLAALHLGSCLGRGVASLFPDARVVIGFAETATALGHGVADELACGAGFLVQTTREPDVEADEWIRFDEEHSHATEQKLCMDGLRGEIGRAGEIVVVDDEISTGKTVANLAVRLREASPALRDRPLVVASVLNRLDDARLAAFREENVRFVCLARLGPRDLHGGLEGFATSEPRPLDSQLLAPRMPSMLRVRVDSPDPRTGGRYDRVDEPLSHAVDDVCRLIGPYCGRLLVLGTEECMYLPLRLAAALRARVAPCRVQFHATTRSPICVCPDPNYPIWNGFELPSVYDGRRTTYIYDMERCDAAVICTDARNPSAEGLSALSTLLAAYGARRVAAVRLEYGA